VGLTDRRTGNSSLSKRKPLIGRAGPTQFSGLPSRAPPPRGTGLSRFSGSVPPPTSFSTKRIRLGWVTTVDVTYATPFRVLIVDDHPLVRRGLTSLLNGTTDIKVVGAASDGEEAVAYAVEEHPISS